MRARSVRYVRQSLTYPADFSATASDGLHGRLNSLPVRPGHNSHECLQHERKSPKAASLFRLQVAAGPIGRDGASPQWNWTCRSRHRTAPDGASRRYSKPQAVRTVAASGLTSKAINWFAASGSAARVQAAAVYTVASSNSLGSGATSLTPSV